MNYQIYKQAKIEQPKLSVILSIYNKEPWLKKTLTSLVEQTCDPTQFEILFVDDASTDDSYSLLKECADQYDHVTLIQCNENSGTPATPRNIGLECARGTWCMIMDADDWLEVTAVEDLLAIAEESEDEIIIGRAIRHYTDAKKDLIIAPYDSYEERRGKTLKDLPYLVFHLSPCAKMFKKSLVERHHLSFPEMKYSEDKWFYFYLLAFAKGISTTQTLVYHINRFKENTSLIRKTPVLEKMATNLEVLQHVLQDKEVKEEVKEMMCVRLLNLDFTTRLFNRKHFLKAENKADYYQVYEKMLSLFHDAGYDVEEEMMITAENKIIYTLASQKRYQDLELFIRWLKEQKEKLFTIEEKPGTQPDELFYQVPVKEVPAYPVPCLATLNSVQKKNDVVEISAQIFADPNVPFEMVIRRRANVNEFVRVQPVHIEKNTYKFYLSRQDFELKLGNYRCEIMLSFLGEKKTNLSVGTFITNDTRFYATNKNNLGFDSKK